MKSVVRWAINNSPAMNTLMLGTLVVGLIAGAVLRRETFPQFELEIILVSVPYPGASPDEVESGICQKVEEAVRSIDGIKKVTSVAGEGSGSVILELRSDVPSVQKILNEVESEVERIPSFPRLSEKPDIQQITMRNPAIKLGIVAIDSDAADSELQLRNVVEGVRDDLLLIPELSVAEISGERAYQIDVEISESTLRKHGMTLKSVADKIRDQNLELPGGKLKGPNQEFLLRGKNKRVRGEEIEDIPLITALDGLRMTVADLGTVSDEFVDSTSISRINGQPGMAISIEASNREDLLAMTAAVREYAETAELPPGYHFEIWRDSSVDVNDRLELLKRNGLQGLLLVFIVLSLFLELRLAFWVALGIPIAVLGSCGVLWQFDQTLNMLSMFAFLIALGIVVDDAIVIGENIYAHREQGKPFVQAAIDGTVEVFPSVAASIATTIIAFMPMFFVTGVMGKFFAVIPLAVIAMLLISLVESSLILPCHLAHDHTNATTLSQRARIWRTHSRAGLTRWVIGPVLIALAYVVEYFAYPFKRLGDLVHWVNGHVSRLLDFVIRRLYGPLLHSALRHPAITCSLALGIGVMSFALVTSGTIQRIIFPKMDTRDIVARVVFPDGTPSHVTDAATKRIESAIQEVHAEYAENGQPLVKLTYRMVGELGSQAANGAQVRATGGHVGKVDVALVDNTERELSSQEIVDMWRERTGEFPGVDSISFGSVNMGPGGTPVEFKLLGTTENMAQLEAAVEECKERLREFPGVFDVEDDSRPGKWEMQLKVQQDADSMGVPLQALAGTVRAGYYGEEVMRVQRGRHEVKIMVRYPAEQRQSLASFQDIRVDAGDGIRRPITELAHVPVSRGYSEINRVNQKRSITISADVDEAVGNAAEIVEELQANFVPGLLERHPEVSVRWEGQQEQTVESMQSLFVGMGIALLVTFGLLTLQFGSYIQPMIVMAVIPFGVIGALWGHWLMDLPLTMFSMFGIVALTGVVVNDSIVLVDFINSRLRAGVPLAQAVLESGKRRFRPVILTSMTTVAGLSPILMETSLQAQILIPMANSLCFGLILATFLVLVLVPTFYRIYAGMLGIDFDMNHADDDFDTRSAIELKNTVSKSHREHSQAAQPIA